MFSGVDVKGKFKIQPITKTVNNKEVNVTKRKKLLPGPWAEMIRIKPNMIPMKNCLQTAKTDATIFNNAVSLEEKITKAVQDYKLYSYNCKDAVVEILTKSTNVNIPSDKAAYFPNGYMEAYNQEKARRRRNIKALSIRLEIRLCLITHLW